MTALANEAYFYKQITPSTGVATYTNPGADPAQNIAVHLAVNYDLNGIPTVNPNFSNCEGVYVAFVSKAGQNAYSPGTQAKRSFIPIHLTHICYAAGQKFLTVASLDAYGMGDSFVSSERLTYAGGPIAGDEGQGFTPVNYLAQQGVLTRTTIASIPTQSLANTTTTQAIVKSRTAQAVTVVSVTGISVNDWVIVGQEAPVGTLNIEAVKVTAVGGGTITGIFTSNHISGTTITPALVLGVASAQAFGEQRVLVNLSGASYSTGTIASPSGGALTGSGTTWAANMVGGGALNVGAIALTNDDFSGAPFSGGSPCKSWYQISAVSSTTSIGIHTYSVAADAAYRGSGSGNYIIRPAARMLRFDGNTAICESSLHTWTVGDTLELAICPYPDVTGFQFRFTAYTRGGSYRHAVEYYNDGARKFDTCINIKGNQTGADGGDAYGWESAIALRYCNYGINVLDARTAAIFLRTEFAGYTDAVGTIIWDSTWTYLKPDTANLQGLKFRPFLSGSADGAISYKDAALTADSLFHAEHDCAVISSKYIKPGSYAVAGVPSAANTGAGSVIYCTNGNAGAACLAVSDGTNWKVLALGATISAS